MIHRTAGMGAAVRTDGGQSVDGPTLMPQHRIGRLVSVQLPRSLTVNGNMAYHRKRERNFVGRK